MSSATGRPAARRLPRRDSSSSNSPAAQPPRVFDDGTRFGFSCGVSAERPGVTRISVAGALDMATSPQLAAALSRPDNGTELVILDLRQVTFIDATGLTVILGADSRLRGAHRRLALIPGPGPVQRLFEITDTDRHLDFLG